MLDLRGNCRTSGEQRRKEAGNVFGEGTRTPISITILVRKPNKNEADAGRIFYRDIGDYLSCEEKRKAVKELHSILSSEMKLSSITPNEAGDWINQRDGLFETFIPLAPEKKYDLSAYAFFLTDSNGIQTNRDSWVYNFSKTLLSENVRRSLAFYAEQLGAFNAVFGNLGDRTFNGARNLPCSRYGVMPRSALNNLSPVDRKKAVDDFIDTDPRKFSWTRSVKGCLARSLPILYNSNNIRVAHYRPFCAVHLYFDSRYNEYPNQIPKLFPTPQSGNKVICVSGVGVTKEFSCIMVDQIPDLELIGKSQCFPLFWYEKVDREQLGLFDRGQDEYRRHSGISDFILKRAREDYGPKVTDEDVFYYVYGLLHSEDYRRRFSNDLKKTLARVPLVPDVSDFRAFVKAGRKLAELHLNYEAGPLCDRLIITGDTTKCRVVKMRFASKDDKGTILFNDNIKIENIPMAAYDYIVNGKSAVEWLMERYAVTTNPDSGIINDPNAWSDNPRYILDLLSRVIQMSVETMKIVAGLPKFDFSMGYRPIVD